MAIYDLKGVGLRSVLLYDEPLPPSDAATTSVVLESEVAPSESVDNFHKGFSISTGIDRIAVGYPAANLVRIFTYATSNWILEEEFQGDQDSVYFGASVCLRGNLLVVGDTDYQNGAGRVHLYEKRDNGWVSCLTPTFECPDVNETQTSFGHRVVLDGGTLLVSAPYHTNNGLGSNIGKVFSYEYLSRQQIWVRRGDLIHPEAQADSYFGSSLGMDNENVVVVGAPNQSVNAGSTLLNAGKVYVFNKTGPSGDSWTNVATLREPTAGAGNLFGWSVSIRAGRIAVGSPETDGIGAAHVFDGFGNNWTISGTLIARSTGGIISDPLAATGDRQGYVVDYLPDHNVMLVSSLNSKSVYLYEQTEAGTWMPAIISKIEGDVNSEWFGWDISATADAFSVSSVNPSEPTITGRIYFWRAVDET